MIDRAVGSEIIYDFMLELSKLNFGDLKDNSTAEIFAKSINTRTRKFSCLLQSFELFWSNPLFFGFTRNFNDVVFIANTMDTRHRPNILATVYKQLSNLYETDIDSNEDNEFRYENVLAYIHRQLAGSYAKQINLIRLNVPLEFIPDKSHGTVRNALNKIYRKLLFSIFDKYKNRIELSVIDKNIMPYL
jgi:hypothetical protein